MRTGRVERRTKETEISVEFVVDGEGRCRLATGVPFLEHMLELMAKHGLFDLNVTAKGDTAVDDHHTVEDIGICLGEAIKKALGDKEGILRYGHSTVPMNETLASVSVDICERPFLVYNARISTERVGAFDVELLPEFFKALTNHSGITLHINIHYGTNAHHMIEAIFKALGKALDQATLVSDRFSDVMSTKGRLG